MFNLYQWWGSRLGGLWLKLLVVDRIYGGCWVLKVFSTAVTEMIWGSGRLEHRKNLCVETTIFVSFFQKCSSWYGFKSVFPFTFLFLSLPFSLSVVFFVFCQLHHHFHYEHVKFWVSSIFRHTRTKKKSFPVRFPVHFPLNQSRYLNTERCLSCQEP